MTKTNLEFMERLDDKYKADNQKMDPEVREKLSKLNRKQKRKLLSQLKANKD